MHAYFIKCNDIIYDKDGNIEEILCTYDPETKSGSGFNERKPMVIFILLRLQLLFLQHLINLHLYYFLKQKKIKIGIYLIS